MVKVVPLKGAKTVLADSGMDETSVVSLLGSKDKPAPQLELGVWIELKEEPESISSVSETTIK